MLDLNPQFDRALDLLNSTKKPVFLTGNAGTGKSTLLKHFRENTNKNVVVLAPTGVAAVNVDGQTIHSFFGFGIGITPERAFSSSKSSKLVEILKNMDTLVIDEISMVRADLLDCIDQAIKKALNLKKNAIPFGGIQVVFIGDLYQLPPVVLGHENERFSTEYKSPYFFDAKCLSGFNMETVQLQKIYRQEDLAFIDVLNKIRNGVAQNEDFAVVNTQLIEKVGGFSDDIPSVTLTTTNKSANEENESRLKRLDAEQFIFNAQITGDFKESHFPTDRELRLKEGSQVMMLNNDKEGRWVNGTVGRIKSIKKDLLVVVFDEPEKARSRELAIDRFEWEVKAHEWNENKKKMELKTLGTFSQFPLRLAWAITIHKSQGKTFDRAVVDMGFGAFAHGQVYVALSRCKSLEGLRLVKNIVPRHIMIDARVNEFHSSTV